MEWRAFRLLTCAVFGWWIVAVTVIALAPEPRPGPASQLLNHRVTR